MKDTVPSYCLNNLQKDKNIKRQKGATVPSYCLNTIQKDKKTKEGLSAIILSHNPNPNLNPKSNDGYHLVLIN